ncbi:conserved hypothetical protein [Talaromyces stipitatus ATCC 10500]|uniref:Uncharacterized protein n=1 Tax=Talaromyces stipitatus (strain ATCC 10500 / CBS 375.48 / QM 6759 / NRRL 1006) TaxID=441959 RepID=B8MAV3_TALSN|nr:uncharacterized protein TSTA_115860 [Talaromyces stipitatus ATCC 10500]EED17793.1 conserved hypothetical protein [Talaromyces stipitatus ATCC 10500]
MTKLVLAVVLAHSLLCIYDGPWFCGHWNRSKIVFYREGSFIPVRPFLCTPTHKISVETANSENFHRFPGILDFGVALLEIYLGQRIASDQNPTNNLWAIASRVLEEQKYNMNSNYRSAVKACLLPDFGTGCDCTPQKFRGLIFSQIVSPLQKELTTFTQGITEVSSLSEFTSRIDLVSGHFYHITYIQERSPLPERPISVKTLSSEQKDLYHKPETEFRSLRTYSNKSTVSNISNNSYSHNSYTVAIICPMGIEMAPVLAMLDKEHSNLPLARHRNKYILGEIGEHRVVVTVMPEIGNNRAAAVVTQLQNDFAELRFGLLVGIGGGIPDLKNDIRLGDVVVSQPVLNFGGVVQFDRGKMLTDNRFERTGHLNKPPALLSSSLETLKARHKQNGNRINDHLTEMLRKYPNMVQEQYIYQGHENDILFHHSYDHESDSDCKDCKRDMLIERQPRESRSPRVHYGTIGSANMVVKDAKIREELKRNLGIICVEMEAAGLMDEFPCLVIRGISDYADSQKVKRWQPYAAAVAAAFAKELLSIVPP